MVSYFYAPRGAVFSAPQHTRRKHLKTNEIKITGQLEHLSDTTTLTVGNSEGETEIQQRDFTIYADCGLTLPATARSDVGSAFHVIRLNARCREGARIQATGYLIGGFTTLMLVTETISVKS